VLTLALILGVFVALALLFIAVGLRYHEANWGHPLSNAIDGWIRIICRRYHRLRGQRLMLPEEPRFILIANHLSGLDPFVLIAACQRPIRFMIAKEEYEKPILNWLFRAAGCIPVDRKGRVEKAFRSALRAIRQGELVALFPQGGIHLSDSEQKQIKAGVVKLSMLTEAPVLAARMQGIRAPGSLFKCIFLRGHLKLEQLPLLSAQQVQHENFREQMAEWLLFKRDDVELG